MFVCPIDTCKGYQKPMEKIEERDGKRYWECPVCKYVEVERLETEPPFYNDKRKHREKLD